MTEQKNRLDHLNTIFSPHSIAVVGTNNTTGTVPHDIFDNLLKSEFQGTLFPVSPGCQSIKCFKTYKYVVDIEDPVDMAILVFPSHVCHMALEQCGQKGIHSVVIISAGFREIGEKGKQREDQLREIAAKYDISFIGPNCLGVINTDEQVRLNASFARRMPEAGNIAFLSQSGALCTAVLDYAYAKHIGFSKFVSFGNKADITEIDLMYYLKDDPETEVILLYLEEITNGRALMEAAQNIIAESGKPILLLKSGRTDEGASAAASHTGSLAGSDEICDAALRQCGIIRCDDIEEMFDAAVAFAYQPQPKGKRVSIITNAGGPGVLVTDSAVRNNLQLAQFGEETANVLRRNLPKTANTKNPVDVIGDAHADRYEIAIETILKDDNVDGAFVILTPQSMTDIEAIAEAVCNQSSKSDKPIYASFMGETDVYKGVDILRRNRIPHYILPESMCRAFAQVYAFTQTLAEEKDPPIKIETGDLKHVTEMLSIAKQNGTRMLSPLQTQDVLKTFGIPVAECDVAQSAREAEEIAQFVGCPVAMKIASPDIIHKFDVGGIRLNIESPSAAAEAYDSICSSVKANQPDADIEGVLIQKMITEGEEVILGLKRDSSFGAVLLFGLGGTYVEILKDVSFAVAPVGPKTIDKMIRAIKAYPLLEGVRGSEARDIASLVKCLSGLSQLAVACPEITELDINPLKVLDSGQGCFAVDARILL